MKQNCTTCLFAEFEKTKSGRRNLERGYCKFVIELPNSYRDLRGDMPRKRAISKYTMDNCSQWVQPEKTK